MGDTIKLSVTAYQDMCAEVTSLKRAVADHAAWYVSASEREGALQEEIGRLTIQLVNLKDELKQERQKRLKFRTIPETDLP